MAFIAKCNDEQPLPPEPAALKWSFPTDPFQNHAFHAIEAGQHVLVTAHTGSGKTLVAEYAIAHALQNERKVIYTAPIKALSNQVFYDLKTKHPEWVMGIKTGDLDLNSDDAQVLIMTTEILRNQLVTGTLDNVSCVIFDEVHWIKDKARGAVWEESIIRMPPGVQMTMLSATLPDAERFGRWISRIKETDVVYVTTDRRVVPLTHYVPTETSRIKVMNETNEFNCEAYRQALREYRFQIPELDAYIGRMQLPAMFFCFSKKKCQEYATSISRTVLDDAKQSVEIENTWHYLVRQYEDQSFVQLQQAVRLKKLLLKGVGYHHSGLLPPLKEIVQELFGKGLIKVLFVTETFAAGVNMPTKTVVFTSLSKIDGDLGQFRFLYPEEYGQMAGRAGRRGLDTVGTVYLMPFHRGGLPKEHEAKELMCGKLRPIVSHFSVDYGYFFRRTLTEEDITSKTLRYQDLLAEGKAELERKKVRQKQLELVQSKVQSLESKHGTWLSDAYKQTKRYEKRELSKKEVKAYLKTHRPWIERNLKDFDSYGKLQKELALSPAESVIDPSVAFKRRIEAFEGLIERLFPGKSDLNETFVLLNEANPLLVVAAVLQDNVFSYASLPGEAIAILSCLVEYNSSVDEVYDPEKDIVPYGVYEAVDEVQAIANRFQKQEGSSDVVTADLDWNAYGQMIGFVYEWCSLDAREVNFEQLRAEYNLEIYEGEFVRFMLKLNNVCKECYTVAEKLNQPYICSLLKDHQMYIVKGIVSPQSLYVQ